MSISLAVCIGHPGSLRSAVKLLVLRHLLVGTHIKRRALVGKQSAAEGKIVAERVAHEIHGVKVPVLEIHRMHLIALRPVYNASDLGPDRRHRAHATGLQGRVERRAARNSDCRSFSPARRIATISAWEVGSWRISTSL